MTTTVDQVNKFVLMMSLLQIYIYDDAFKLSSVSCVYIERELLAMTH